MVEIFALIILILSALGLVVMVWRKIPALVDLPEVLEEPRDSFLVRFKNKIFVSSLVREFRFLTFLQKILSKFMVLTLKAENKTADWLHKLRQKSQKQNSFENDNYWQELKNAKRPPRNSKRKI